MNKGFTISISNEKFAICRLEVNDAIPERIIRDSFFSVTHTPDELSVVCHEASAPVEATVEKGYRCLMVKGPLPFNQIGVISSLSAVLAAAEISIFAISTYDTDYILVPSSDLDKASTALSSAGNKIIYEQ